MNSERMKILRITICILAAVCMLFAAALAGSRFWQHEKRQSADITKLQEEIFSKEKTKEVFIPEIYQLQSDLGNSLFRQFAESEGLNAWQKLACKKDISLLVVGDSIGARTWTYDVSEWIERNYQIRCTIRNLSMGGNTSYGGYVSEKLLEEETAFDLVIVCYGENDLPELFARDYEALIRELYRRNDRCCIISVLESSQREYTEKMQQIIRFAPYYELCLADTIEAFDRSGYAYEVLSDDGQHPNEKGGEIYAETVERVISEQTADAYQKLQERVLTAFSEQEEIDLAGLTTAGFSKPPLDQEVLTYEAFRYIPSRDFQRINDTDWEIQLEGMSGILGISRNMCPGINTLKIYLDDELVYDSGEVNWRLQYALKTVDRLLPEARMFQGSMRVSFGTKEAADQFFGIVLTDFTQL